MWSGGKDSCLALMRAQRQKLVVTTLVNIYDQATGRVRFHATRRELIQAQAAALGIALLQPATTPEAYERTFVTMLGELARRGIRGVILGDIHLADVRAWFEERVSAARLEHVEPLWQEPSRALLEEFISSGCQAVVTCVELAKLPGSWLGRALDDGFLVDIGRHPKVDPCGEHGEYHTFVYGGPPFVHPIPWRPGRVHEEGGFAQLELLSR
jgi:uncharacterized protein (TIGR00290 family)